MEEITGVIENVVFQSEDNSYSVLRIESRKAGHFTAVYHGPAPYVGENVELEGEWIEHARFGQQLDIKVLHVVEPTSVTGIESFLSSGAVKGIGKAFAKRIVDKFGVVNKNCLCKFINPLIPLLFNLFVIFCKASILVTRKGDLELLSFLNLPSL